MDIPGATGALDPEAWDKAQAEQERLLEDLKKEVKAELKEIGVLRKELRVTVPAKTIAEHMEHNYDELMHDAFVPGFRKGHAPRQLIEKRFGAEVRESLTSSIVGQSYYAVIENEELEVLGEPLFSVTTDAGVKLMDIGEALEYFKLPESGDFSYTCEVELKPKFDLPELKGIKVRAPEVTVTDEMVNEHMLKRRKMRGRLEPVPDEPAQKDDQVIVDAVLKVDGQEIRREENVTLGVRPASVEGIPLLTLDEDLGGANPGETRTSACKIPPDFDRTDLRGKDGVFEFRIHELKRLAPEPLADFVEAWGFDSEDEVRAHLRTELEAERDQLIQRAKRAQIEAYLLEKVEIDLPEEFSTAQTARAVARQVVDLQQRGIPPSDIEARIDELRTSAKEEVASELKLSFILEKVAEELDISVTDEEINTEIARIARLYGRRFDRVRDDMQNRGLLEQLVEQIRQGKCVSKLLEQAELVAIDAEEQPDKETAKKATKKKAAKKKAAKKATKKTEKESE